MRKYLIGTIFGFVLATAVGANAQEVNRLIDSVVQGVFPVTVEGTSVGDAIVVNDKTYLPVRALAETLGYAVSFTENREVVLTKNGPTTESQTAPLTPVPTPAMSKQEIEDKIEFYKAQIRIANISISTHEENIKINPDKATESQKWIESLKTKIAEYESQIAELQKGN